MTTLQIGRTVVFLSLSMVSGVAHADVVSNSPANGKLTVPIAKPTVKLGQAMLQEREVLSNGTVRTQTTLLPATAQPVKGSHVRKTGK